MKGRCFYKVLKIEDTKIIEIALKEAGFEIIQAEVFSDNFFVMAKKI